MKMEGMEIIMAEDGVDETGERGDQPLEDAVQEEGIEGTAQGFQLGGAGPEHGLFPLVIIARRHSAHGGELLLRDRGRAQGRLVPGG